MRELLKNPELIRLLRARLRPRTLLIQGLLTLVGVGAVLSVLYYIDRSMGFFSWSKIWSNFFAFLVYTQLAVLAFYGLVQASQAVTQEREKATFDFQRLVAMGLRRLVLGKMLGACCEAWWICLLLALSGLMPVLGGGISFAAYLQIELVIMVTGLLVGALGVALSCVFEKSSRAAGLAVMIPLALFFLSLATSSSENVPLFSTAHPLAQVKYLLMQEGFNQLLRDKLANAEEQEDAMLVKAIKERDKKTLLVRGVLLYEPGVIFFNSSLPVWVGFLAFHVPLILLLYLFTVRRLTDEELSFLHPWHALVAVGYLQFMLICDYGSRLGEVGALQANTKSGGGMTEHYIIGPTELCAYHLVNLFALVGLAFALTPSAELLRGRLHRACRNEHWKVIFEWPGQLQDAPAVRPMFSVTCIYVLSAVMATATLGIHAVQAYGAIIVVAGLGLGMTALLLYIQAYSERSGFKLALVILMLGLSIPVLCVGLSTQNFDDLVYFSPVAYISELDSLRGHDYRYEGIGQIWTMPLVVSAGATLLFPLAGMRMRHLLDLYALQMQRAREESAKTRLPAGRSRSPGLAAQALENALVNVKPISPVNPESSAPPLLS